MFFCHYNEHITSEGKCHSVVSSVYPACLSISIVFLSLTLIVYLADDRYVQYQICSIQTFSV